MHLKLPLCFYETYSQLHNYLLNVCWCAALPFQTLKFNQGSLFRSNLFKKAQQDSEKQFQKTFQ